jgi:hypothetical protein
MKSGSEPSVSKAMKSQREVEIGGLFGPISGALAFIHSGNLVRGHMTEWFSQKSGILECSYLSCTLVLFMIYGA